MGFDLFRLDGKVAVVTGARRGLGSGIAAALAEAGADIVSVQRSESAPELEDKVLSLGRRLLVVPIDIAQENAAKVVLQRTLDTFGHADILVNNAGIQRRAPAAEFPLAYWDEVVAVNLRAVFLFCQTFGNQMLKQGHGKIINISSLLAMQGGFTIPAYTASKHGVAGLTKALCNEWAHSGVNVNAIAPGYMDTDMNVALINDSKRNAAISERIPAGRWGQPEDMGGAAVFLASAASDYIHGQTIVVDGGWMAR